MFLKLEKRVFPLAGSETRLCQSNGNFSGDVPVCEHLEVDLLMDMLPDDGEMAEPVSCGPPNLQGTKAKVSDVRSFSAG